jgi:ribosomal protein S27AE
MLERLDRLPAGRWARLRDDVRRCRLRRGAWYPVLSLGPDEAVVVVRHESVILPQTYLEIVTTRPDRWTVISAERYAVCPNCAQRVAVGTAPERMRCGRCSGVFAFEPQHEDSAIG